MRAYTGAVNKDAFLRMLSWHRSQDKIVQGHYWDSGDRGCAIGCSVQSLRLLTGCKISYDDHHALAGALGIPVALIALQDQVFEGLPANLAPDWPIQFASAIQPGADLSAVWRSVAVRILREVSLWLARNPHTAVAMLSTVAQVSWIGRVANGIESRWTNDDPAQLEEAVKNAGVMPLQMFDFLSRAASWQRRRRDQIISTIDATEFKLLVCALPLKGLCTDALGMLFSPYRAIADILIEELRGVVSPENQK